MYPATPRAMLTSRRISPLLRSHPRRSSERTTVRARDHRANHRVLAEADAPGRVLVVRAFHSLPMRYAQTVGRWA